MKPWTKPGTPAAATAKPQEIRNQGTPVRPKSRPVATGFAGIMLLVGLLICACSSRLQVRVQDKDSGRPLSAVRVMGEKNGKRTLLTRSNGTGALVLNSSAFDADTIWFFKNYYRPRRFRPTTLRNRRALEVSMTETRAPQAVSGIKLSDTGSGHTLEWKPSPSPDTASYSVYLRSGLDPREICLKKGLTNTEIDAGKLEQNTDYFFRIKAVDHNGNHNRGTLFHVYLGEAQIQLPATAYIQGQVRGSGKGPIRIEAHPVNLGAWGNYSVAPTRFACRQDGSFRSPALPPGRYTLIAFRDENNNQAWDGHWLGSTGEPRARRSGIQLGDGGTVTADLVLRRPPRGLPRPIFAENKGYASLYRAAWDFAREKISKGNVKNGFTHAYMDEGFNNHIYQWDTCFMMFFGIYGGAEFPAMNSIDNFYHKQHANGYICRVQNEDTGGDYAPKQRDPHVNPPLYAWVEYRYYRVSGDDSRLLRAIHHNHRYFTWLKRNIRTAEGYYFTSNLGSGMDNSPREGQAHGWVDITSQMALSAWYMVRLARAAGLKDMVGRYQTEFRELKRLINARMWDKQAGLYFDVKVDGSLHRKKTIASFWPLLARVATPSRSVRLVQQLKNPATFHTPHLFPTLARSEAEYDPKGYYWRGSVWAPTTFMVIKGLQAQGYEDFARSAARNHLDNMLAVYRDFTPARRKLPYGHANIPFPEELDGTKQIWECYSPEKEEPATRWDNFYYVRPKFVGWSGVGPITLLIENVIGIRPDAPRRRIQWRVSSERRHGLQGLSFLGGTVDLVMEEIRNGIPQVRARSDVAFTLEILYKGKKFTRQISARSGRS